MGRRIIYRIEDRAENRFTEGEWEEVERLQHWYNSEFTWSTGRIALKRYILFPNAGDFENVHTSFPEVISQRRASLRAQGLSESEIIAQLERDNLFVVKWGGYSDNCLASGFTRIADNEWNAFLVCDFVLKASTLCPNAAIDVADEGKFIKSGSAMFKNGHVTVKKSSARDSSEVEKLCSTRRVFSLVDAEKYGKHPAFGNLIPEFGKLKKSERTKIVQNWNWLGYGGNFDANGDDLRGFDLNIKVRSFVVAP